MMMKAPSTSAGYRRTIASSCAITIRIATMPSIPPVSTTHRFGDIATATRIESTENAILTSSTLTTVAQNADRPSHGRAGLGLLARLPSPPRKKCRYVEVEQVEAAEQLYPGERMR